MLSFSPLYAEGAGRAFLSCDRAESWVMGNGGFTLERSPAVGWVVKLSTKGNGRDALFRHTFHPPLVLKDEILETQVKVADSSAVMLLKLRIKTADGKWRESHIHGRGTTLAALQSREWNRVTIATAPVEQITEVEIRFRDKGTAPAVVWFDEFAPRPKKGTPMVSITFDDGWSSVFTHAFPSMRRHRFAGTAYVVPGMTGQERRMTLEQLRKLQNQYRWDISSHSLSHKRLTEIPLAQLRSELEGSKNWLVANGLAKGSEHLAYPFGAFDSPAILSETKKYYRTARLIYGPTETLPVADPARLRVMLVVNTTKPSDVAAKIDAALRNREWLILVFHQVVDGPAKFDTQVSSADFDAMMNLLAQKKIAVLPVSEAWERATQ